MSTSVAPPPGAHGGDGAVLAARLGVPVDEILDLSVSLNPCAPDAATIVAAHASAVRRYPEPARATAALASAMAVDPDRLVLTNGGAEAIALVAGELPVGRVDEPDFSLYPRHLARLDPTGLRWASNPRTPTGRLADADERADVWDEAFYPLATGMWTRGDVGAVVVGSLTKLFACPGLRVGYMLAPDTQLAARLRDRQPEWSVNALACAAVPALLEMAALAMWRNAIAAHRTLLADRLRTAGLDPERSDAPWLLVHSAPNLREHLARRGVLVRDTSTFGIAGGVRIAVPDQAGLDRFAEALEGWKL